MQIETPRPRVRPQPVETRRILMTVRKRPEIVDAYVSPVAVGDPIGETRVRILRGNHDHFAPAHLRTASMSGSAHSNRSACHAIGRRPDPHHRSRCARIQSMLDHPAPRPIPPAAQLQAGPLEVQLIAIHAIEGVQGGLGQGTAVGGSRSYRSNSWLLQLAPRVTAAIPPAGNAVTILRVTGNRLWHPGARTVEVIVGDAAIPVRAPGVATPGRRRRPPRWKCP